MDETIALQRSQWPGGHAVLGRRSAAALLYAAVAAHAGVIVWLWIHGGNLHVPTTGALLTSIGRITGLLSAYLALLQVVLLARLPWLERAVGFDRLGIWHRWNGHACLDLVIAHVVFTVWGYALMDRFGLGKELSTMLGGGVYPGMITATIGTALLIGVVATSLVIVRRRLSYEWWYAVHLLAYAGIALSWFHEIPTGNELVLDHTAADYWRALYVATLAILVVFQILVPVAQLARHRLVVADVVQEAPGVVSVRIVGRRLDRLHAEPGQFFLWRFLDRKRIWSAHPFSLSAAPDPRSLRITVKAVGDHSARIDGVRPGTRVLAEGPFGVFTETARRRREKVLLIAGGIGITPIRSMIERMRGDVVVVYRALSDGDLIFRRELDGLAARSGLVVRYVTGDHRGDGARLLSPEHLREVVPDAVAARRLPLRPSGDDGCRQPESPRRRRAAPADPRRTIRPHLRERKEKQRMRRGAVAVLGAAALALPNANAWAAATAQKATVKNKVVSASKSFTGSAAQADRWGEVEVTIVVKKTTTTNLTTKKKTVKRKIIAVKVPISPNHTGRSVFINEQALPVLIQETMQAQSASINLVSGATDSSDAFGRSLQSAILKAKAW